MEDIKFIKICVVDTDNRFKFLNHIFEIDQSVEAYKVHNKAVYQGNKIINEYTNYAKMSKIKVVMEQNKPIVFYDEDGFELDSANITIVK